MLSNISIQVKNSTNPKYSFKRVNIMYKFPNGTVGKLLVRFNPGFFSTGLQATYDDLNPSVVEKFKIPLFLFSQEGTTPEQQQFYDGFQRIVEYIKQQLVDIKDELEVEDLDIRDLKRLSPLWWPREKGKIIANARPVLYAPINIRKKDGIVKEVLTTFSELSQDGRRATIISPDKIMNTKCIVFPALNFDNVYVGAKGMKLQVLLWEANVRIMGSHNQRVLLPPESYYTEPEKPVVSDEQVPSSEDGEEYEYEDLAPESPNSS